MLVVGAAEQPAPTKAVKAKKPTTALFREVELIVKQGNKN
jgi:hypothetical protein